MAISSNRCLVCSDVASGYHYSIRTCESCKGFFKRSIQNKKVFYCQNDSNCTVELEGRRKCAACRLKKCLSCGMKTNLVRENRRRGGRNDFNYREKKLQESVSEEINVKPYIPPGVIYPNHASFEIHSIYNQNEKLNFNIFDEDFFHKLIYDSNKKISLIEILNLALNREYGYLFNFFHISLHFEKCLELVVLDFFYHFFVAGNDSFLNTLQHYFGIYSPSQLDHGFKNSCLVVNDQIKMLMGFNFQFSQIKLLVLNNFLYLASERLPIRKNIESLKEGILFCASYLMAYMRGFMIQSDSACYPSLLRY